jgi:hypothetical protein
VTTKEPEPKKLAEQRRKYKQELAKIVKEKGGYVEVADLARLRKILGWE